MGALDYIFLIAVLVIFATCYLARLALKGGKRVHLDWELSFKKVKTILSIGGSSK